MKIRRLWLIVFAVATVASPASAQLFASRGSAIASGHVHINTADAAEQKRFWHVLGGETVQFYDMEVIQFPNLVILFNDQKPTGGTRGSSLNHIGFEVPDVRETVRKIKAAGYQIVTQTEVSGGRAKGEIFHSASQNVDLAFLLGPEDMKVEVMESRKLDRPVIAHHFHVAAPDVEAVRDWYVKTFGARPDRRGAFEEALLPGIRVTLLQADKVAGTKGRVIDHIGFEVNGIKQLCDELKKQGVELDPPYNPIPRTRSATAYLHDPVGTYIELTEGLDQIGGMGRGAKLE